MQCATATNYWIAITGMIVFTAVILGKLATEFFLAAHRAKSSRLAFGSQVNAARSSNNLDNTGIGFC